MIWNSTYCKQGEIEINVTYNNDIALSSSQ